MGLNKKQAKGPNPLANMRSRKVITKSKKMAKKRPPRKGKRSKALSELKKA